MEQLIHVRRLVLFSTNSIVDKQTKTHGIHKGGNHKTQDNFLCLCPNSLQIVWKKAHLLTHPFIAIQALTYTFNSIHFIKVKIK